MQATAKLATTTENLKSGLPDRLIALARQRRPYVIVLMHLVMFAVANYCAFWLRFDGNIPPVYLQLWKSSLPVLIAIRMLVFFPFRLYGGLWRYTSIHELRKITIAVVTGTSAFLLIQAVVGHTSYPRSIYLVDSLLLIFLMGGARLVPRIARESWKRRARAKTVLVYGAGDAGEMIVRDMKNNPHYDKEPVGFIDDDETKVGVVIHGVPVLGTRRDLPDILRRTNVS